MKDTPSKLDQIRSLGQTEIFRRFGAPTERKPIPEIPGVTKGVNTVNEKTVHAAVHRPVHVPDAINGAEARKAYRREWMRKQRAKKNAGQD